MSYLSGEGVCERRQTVESDWLSARNGYHALNAHIGVTCVLLALRLIKFTLIRETEVVTGEYAAHVVC